MTEEKKEENPKRFLPQCFMMEFYRDFVKRNINTTYGSFCKINVEPAKAINSITNKQMGFALNDLTPAQLSRLVPKFRLFKLYNDKDPVEFMFDSHTTLLEGDTNTFANYTDFTVSAAKRPMAVGFKSFSWEDLGTNPANQGLSFKASLVLSCPNMQSLFRKVNGLSFDELICPASRKRSGANPVYDGKENRMRADVGWVLPPSFDNSPKMWGTKEQRDKIRTAIQASQVSLFLNLTQHELSISEDGTVELSVEFMASLEAGLASPNSDLFYLGEKNNQDLKFKRTNVSNQQRALEDLRKQAKDKESAIEKQKKDDGEPWIDSKKTDRLQSELSSIEDAIDLQEEELEKLKKQLAELQELELGKKYQALLARITEKGRFFYVDIDDKMREAMTKLQELYTDPSWTPEELAERRKVILKDLRLFEGQNAPSATPNSSATQANQTFNIADEYKKAAKKPAKRGSIGSIFMNNRKEEIQESVVEGGQSALSNVRKGKDIKRINYMYFGDLFEAAFGIVRENQKKEGDKLEWRYMLGMIELYDPDLDKNVCVNIADLPVCWEYFQSFFLDKVIKPAKTKWNIRMFLKDIISELLIGSLSPTCFGKLKAETRTKVNIQTLILPGQGGRCSDSPFPVGGENFIDVKNKVQWNGTRESKNYLFVYPKGGVSPRRIGNRDKDEAENIMHLQIGSDRGILKSISFQRQDMPGQREANIKKTTDGGGEVGNLLFSNRYNADLTLVGNTLFTNGSTIYVDPRGLGIGGLNQANSMAKKLGVGGYYFVKKVDYSIEAGKFETNLSTVLQGLGTPKDNKAEPLKESLTTTEEKFEGGNLVSIDSNTTRCN